MPSSFERPRPYRAFALGLTTGLTYFTGTLYWLTDVMVMFGDLARPVAMVLALLLIAYLALFPALFAMIVVYARRRIGPEALLLAPGVWVATELGRGYLLTGFPWVPLGNSQVSVLPVAQLASVFGVYGLSALVALPAAGVAYAVHVTRGRRAGAARWSALSAVAAVLIGVVWWGNARLVANELLQQGSPLKVGIVQGNIAQTNKWSPTWRDRILTTYLDLSRQVVAQKVELIVWPEASIPFLFEVDKPRAEGIKALVRETGTPMLIGGDQVERGTLPPQAGTDGASHARPADRYYNAAFMLKPDGTIAGVYRKVQLVPFGEYVPLKSILFFAGPIIEAVGDFYPGTSIDVLPLGDRRVSTGICYEAVFPNLARAAVLAGSQLLTTITNDAWYGTSSAPYQHFEQARMRAIENGRYLVRAANTGISGAVDPYGRILLKTELFVPAAVPVDVRLLDSPTLYVRIGDAFAYACVALTALTLIASSRQPVLRA